MKKWKFASLPCLYAGKNLFRHLGISLMEGLDQNISGPNILEELGDWFCPMIYCDQTSKKEYRF